MKAFCCFFLHVVVYLGSSQVKIIVKKSSSRFVYTEIFKALHSFLDNKSLFEINKGKKTSTVIINNITRIVKS